ncbi:MAG: hydroxyacid dehydrogenase [Deltaproteobacteria bacterium]|nr:MAG: hydroxyacid dehydrogenase [Deltaproteobacteria bacterium]
MKVASLGRCFLEAHHLESLERLHGILVEAEGAVQDSEAVEVVMSSGSPVGAAWLHEHPRVRWALAASAGFDQFDLVAARAAGVVVCHCPDYATQAVAEHTFGLLLALLRHVPTAAWQVRSGGWAPLPLRGGELAGRTLGVIGFGRIGQRVAVLARSFGMQVLAVNRSSSEEQRLRLLRESDVVTLPVPLDESTRGLIGEEAIAAMRPGALLVNTSCGRVVDSEALLKGIRSGKLGGAALDVLEGEPDVSESLLLAEPKVLITPHVGGYTQESVARLATACYEAPVSFARGKPLHIVPPLRRSA